MAKQQKPCVYDFGPNLHESENRTQTILVTLSLLAVTSQAEEFFFT
jgi:hypothetical protein